MMVVVLVGMMVLVLDWLLLLLGLEGLHSHQGRRRWGGGRGG